jgi:hypothetical protein
MIHQLETQIAGQNEEMMHIKQNATSHMSGPLQAAIQDGKAMVDKYRIGYQDLLEKNKKHASHINELMKDHELERAASDKRSDSLQQQLMALQELYKNTQASGPAHPVPTPDNPRSTWGGPSGRHIDPYRGELAQCAQKSFNPALTEKIIDRVMQQLV